MYIAIIVIIIIILLMIGVFIISYYGQSFLFNPDIVLLSSPFDSIDIVTNKGLHAWCFDRGTNTPIVIFSHGNAGNISYNKEIIDITLELGFSLILYDYRGFGNSRDINNNNNEKTPTTTSIINDGIDIYQEIINRYPNRKIIIWGQSMGSAVATYLASIHPEIKLLVIQSGYAKLKDVITNVAGSLISSVFSVFHKCPNNIEIITTKNISIPTLIIHATDDTLIPYSQAQLLYNSLQGNKYFISAVGGHNFSLIPYVNEMQNYFNTQSINATNKT